jgi:RNA polymerase sigma-70 factor (ECF subfamily)
MLEKSVQDDWGAMLVKEISYIRGFAISLAGSVTAADDLVQDTLIRALVHRNTFDLESPTRNVRAWLITILHNAFYSSYRKHNREVQDTNGFFSQKVAVRGGQEPRLEMQDFCKALDKLSDEHREVLLMIGLAELSYEEAALLSNVPTGTIKSRVSRARVKLVQALGYDGKDVAVNAARDTPTTAISKVGHSW